VPFNDTHAVERAFEMHPDSIAAVIVEPYPGNMGLVLPRHGFLRRLRQLCTHYGALLIFDEVMSGFRVARGGAQELESVVPDLTTLGKVIGGGLPAAAFGGRSDVMAHLSPDGPVYQAGTLSGNPLAMRAGLATLPELEAPGFYDDLNKKAERLADGLRSALSASHIPGQVNVAGSLLTLFFSAEPVRDYAAAKKSDAARFAAFFRAMFDRGIFLPPSRFEALFVSTAHSNADIDSTISAARSSLSAISS
jgi:glutamate-1-semialdehyde 2,1-aminomutase